MNITDEDIPVNTGDESFEDVLTEVKQAFIEEEGRLGFFRPRLFIYSKTSYLRILEASVRDVEDKDDKNLALAEVANLCRVCGTSNGLFFYDDVFVDEITDESQEAVVCMAFNNKGMMITFIPYEKSDSGIVFDELKDVSTLDIDEVPKEIISTLAFSIDDDDQNAYANEYIEVLRKRGHQVDVLQEDEVNYVFPI